MRIERCLAFAVGAVLLGSCHATPAARGHTDAPTLVSLNPCSDAILAEIADPARIRGLSHYSFDPRATSMPIAQARRFRAVGDSVEEVLALKPDIVIASVFLSPVTQQAYRRLGVRVETFGVANSVDDSIAQIRRLGILIGREPQAEALIKKIALAARPADIPAENAVLWQSGALVAGGHSLISELMSRAGFANHAAQKGYHQGDYLSLESILADPPRVLLVAGDERGQRHPALDQLKGQTDIVAISPSLLYCGGPTIIRAMRELRAVRMGLK